MVRACVKRLDMAESVILSEAKNPKCGEIHEILCCAQDDKMETFSHTL